MNEEWGNRPFTSTGGDEEITKMEEVEEMEEDSISNVEMETVRGLSLTRWGG